MNAVDALDATFDVGGDAGLFQFVPKRVLNGGQELLAFFSSRVNSFLHLLIPDRIEVTESQVFELAANLTHPEAVGDRRINVEGLAGNFLLALLGQMLERAHVVQTVGELNKPDADVVNHGEHHLAQIFGLLLFARREINLADLRNALHYVRNLFTEFFANINDGERSVFDRIVQ